MGGRQQTLVNESTEHEELEISDQKIEAFCEAPACRPDESNFGGEHASIFVELDGTSV